MWRARLLRRPLKKLPAPQSTPHHCRARPCPSQTAGKERSSRRAPPQCPLTGVGHGQMRAKDTSENGRMMVFTVKMEELKRNNSIKCSRMRGYWLPDQKDSPIRPTTNDKSSSMPRQTIIKFHSYGYKSIPQTARKKQISYRGLKMKIASNFLMRTLKESNRATPLNTEGKLFQIYDSIKCER